jgi:hypothetical protein
MVPTEGHETSVLPSAVALSRYDTFYALDRATGVRFPVSNKLFSCAFLDFRSGVDEVPFCGVTYCEPRRRDHYLVWTAFCYAACSMNRPINVINSDLDKCFYFEINKDFAVVGSCDKRFAARLA